MSAHRRVLNSRAIAWTVVSTAGVCAAFYLLAKIPGWRNDSKLAELRANTANYPMPAKSELLYFDDGDTAFGNFGPASSACYYRVRISLVTELSEEETRRFYERARIKGATRGDIKPVLWFGDSWVTGAGKSRRHFILEVQERTDAGWDLRCH